jgi:hypothetical protein
MHNYTYGSLVMRCTKKILYAIADQSGFATHKASTVS